MDLLGTPEDKRFREEVRAFLAAHLPADMRQRIRSTGFVSYQDQRQWQRTLDAHGWGAPAWPVAHGGTGWNAGQQMIFADECAMASAPTPHIFNITMLGPVIIHFGNDAQREFFLPRLLNGGILSCQGFSEPNSGSDLASLQTSARRVDGGYVVNGSKIWTSQAHASDWIFCLLRTDSAAAKKQAGISFVVIDLKSPGVTIRPIIGIDDRHSLNQVFFDDVLVPQSGLIGEENKGWDYAKFLLGHERTYVAGIGRTRERMSYARELLASRERAGLPAKTAAAWRGRIALIETDVHALEITQLRLMHAGIDQNMASLLKVRGSELYQEIVELAMQIGGAASLRGDCGELTTAYLYSRAVTIYGGSTEVQKNILASTVIGL
ncbi:acyl-CoA dehydrogenase family protein [Cupriavidus sp. 2MCAB6]|uniref:acyl-CoA dehydrogenase family protein n=1 Tax=Cupriavidus sp. 2MCAB6 TaxID=3232981 RepID=UPI003F933C48